MLAELLAEQRLHREATALANSAVATHREQLLGRWAGFWLFESPLGSPLLADAQSLHHGRTAAGARKICEMNISFQAESTAEYCESQRVAVTSVKAAPRVAPVVRIRATWLQGGQRYFLRGVLGTSLIAAEDCAIHRRVQIPPGRVCPAHQSVDWAGTVTPAKVQLPDGKWKIASVDAEESASLTSYAQLEEFVSPCCLQLVPSPEGSGEELVLRFDRKLTHASPSGVTRGIRNAQPRLWVVSVVPPSPEKIVDTASSLGGGGAASGCGEMPRTWRRCDGDFHDEVQLVLAAQRRAERVKRSCPMWLPCMYICSPSGGGVPPACKYPNTRVVTTGEFDNLVLNHEFAAYWFNGQSETAFGFRAQEVFEAALGAAHNPAHGAVLLPIPHELINQLKASSINFLLVECFLPKSGEVDGALRIPLPSSVDEIGFEDLRVDMWPRVQDRFSSIELAGLVLSEYGTSKKM